MLGVLVCGLPGLPAAGAESSGLRYGFKTDQDYLYEITIVGEVSDRKSTNKGILTYRARKDSDAQFILAATGILPERWESTDDGPSIGPRPPFGPPMGLGMPVFAGQAGTTFSRTGKVISTKSDAHLPFVLGLQDSLVVEPLPEGSEESWTTTMDIAVVERMSVGPFFSRLRSFQGEMKTIAKEQIDYNIVEKKGAVVRIRKTYSMKTLPDEGIVRFDMSGGGEFEFDTERGVIISHSAEYKILVNEKNITLAIPVSVNYRLLSDAEMAERKKQRDEAAAAKAAAMEPKPFEPGEREKLITELRSGNPQRVQAAAQRLSRVIRDDQPADDIGRALVAALTGTNASLHKDVFKALVVWTVPEAKPAAISAMKSRMSPFVGDEALAVLAKFKTADVAQAVAGSLVDPHNRRKAADALIAMGPIAEEPTIPFIKDRDHWVCSEACRVVGEIGGQKSLQALKEQLVEHRGPMGPRDFTQAIDAIERRGGQPPAMPAEAESSELASDGVARIWHDATRSFQVEAQFVKFENDQVTLRRKDGRVITLPLEKLCEEDRKFVEDQSKVVNPFE